MAELSESELIITSLTDTDVSASVASSSCSDYSTARNESIEESKVHWSHLSDVDSDLTDDQIAAHNREVFKSLQSHPVWAKLFITFNEESGPSLVVGRKFAEGAQAEIFSASVDWHRPAHYERRYKWELQNKYALKVFKKGTLLQHLQSQWPHGYLQWLVKDVENKSLRFQKPVVRVSRGTLLLNGEFAFLMLKEDEDLRNLIAGNNAKRGNGCGPFPKKTSIYFMYQIANGVDWLHKQNIVHRDLKASNILVSKRHFCYVGDYECSIGVIGTGFWRDPQILQACKERNASQRPELFTKAAYSYAMTCYEILRGKLPFEGEAITMDLVVEGQRPKVPDYVDEWIYELLCLCWHSDRDVRPTFEEVMDIIVANASSSRLKAEHDWNMKNSNEETNPLLGCDNFSHSLELLDYTPCDHEVYKCRLCLKEGRGAVYHCTPCGDFDLHPECATIPLSISSFMHSHDMILCPGFLQYGEKIVCNACQFEILKGTYYTYYKCPAEECNFHLHIYCANYARTIAHYLHEEHELELITMSTLVGTGKSLLVCNGCNIQLDPLEIVYSCRECGFNIHPHCIIGKLECKSW